jgi:hypothetical protein
LRCIFAKTAEVDVAHIIPQTGNDTKENVELALSAIDAAEALFDPDVWDEILALFADEGNLRSSDKPWNMLCLNKQLHWHLEHRFLVLECLDTEPCHVDDGSKRNESDGSSRLAAKRSTKTSSNSVG